MSITSLGLDSSWRDYWGMWNPSIEPYMAPLERSKCHAPRWAFIPSEDKGIFDVSGKITYNFHLVPGSVIWGLMSMPNTVQLTDVGTGHQLFQEPVGAFITGDPISAQLGGNIPSFFLLPCPWPVTGDGLFTLEAWGTVDARFVMLLGIAEVTDCVVK